MRNKTAADIALLLAGVAAILPAALHAESPGLSQSATGSVFAPTDQPLTLTRTVRRSLPGGKELIATRSYAVRILRQSSGYIVEGALVDSQVQAPPQLAALAEIERKRPDLGMFPILLDSAGIIASKAPARTGASLARAAETVTSTVGQTVPDSGSVIQAQAFIQHVRNQGAGSQWPEDLFRPQPGQRQQSQEVSLGDGTQGRVIIETDADAATDSGVLQRFTRTVTTELGGTQRVTREEWTLTQAR